MTEASIVRFPTERLSWQNELEVREAWECGDPLGVRGAELFGAWLKEREEYAPLDASQSAVASGCRGEPGKGHHPLICGVSGRSRLLRIWDITFMAIATVLTFVTAIEIVVLAYGVFG